MTEAQQPDLDAFARHADTDCSLAYMGNILSFLGTAAETGGCVSVIQAHSRKGNEPPPHVHHREHEMFFVLDGELEVFCEGRESGLTVGRGELVFLPAGKAHAMYFDSATVRLLLVLCPAPGGAIGLEDFFKEMADGPASSMVLPENAAQYHAATPSQMEAASRSAKQNGLTLLTAEEIARRLPAYGGLGANLRAMADVTMN